MRVASWAFVACMLFGVIAVFLPSVQVEVSGTAVSRRATLSLYRAETNREVVRRWLQGYGRSQSKRVGGALVAVLLPHTKGAVNDHLDDVSSAMTDLEGVSDDDVKTAGRILTVLLWTIIALHVLAGGLVVRGLVQGARRASVIAALVLAVVIAAVGVGLHVGWAAAVFEVNDEIGHDVLGLASGAWVSPAAGLGALVAVIAILIGHLRHPRVAGLG